MYGRVKHKCSRCGRFTSDPILVYMDGEEKTVCLQCFLAYTFYETIRDMLRHGTDDEVRYVIRVLEGINDLIEDNPLVQAIIYVIDIWIQKYPKPLFMDELRREWAKKDYKMLSLDKILDYLVSEEILMRAKLPNSERIMLVPGTILKELLKRFKSSRELYRDIVRAVTGLIVVRYLFEPSSPKFRYIYATLQAIGSCIEQENRVPVYEVKGYRCRLCGSSFSTKMEAREHVLREHICELRCLEEDCILGNIEVETGRELGIWCDYYLFVEKADVYRVKDLGRFFRYLLTRGAILPQEKDEIVKEIDGKKYVAVDIGWIRVRERMKALERQIIRGR